MNVRIATLAVLAIAGLFVLLEGRDFGRALPWLTEEHARIHASVGRLGLWAPIAFTAAYALLMMLIWFPSWPCSVAGGFLFGPWAGCAYSLIGSTLGAVAVFELTRSGLAHRMPHEHPIMRRLDDGFRRDAFEYTVVLRVLPVMPFGIVHVAAGALGIPLSTFTLGTIIGMVPCVFIYAFLGQQLATVAASRSTLDLEMFAKPSVSLPLFALAALGLVPTLIRAVRARRSRTG